MTDLHFHALWGLDDGAKTPEETAGLLRKAAAQGVTTVVATPHILPGLEPFDPELYRSRLEEARRLIAREGLGIRLLPGSEVFYTPYLTDWYRDGRLISMNDGPALLLEFDTGCEFDKIRRAAEETRLLGIRMIVAHAERYDCLRRIDRVRELKERWDAAIQVNARTVTRRSRVPLFSTWCEKLIRMGLVDAVASDAHALPGREPSLGPARQVLEDRWSPKVAELLTVTLPNRLLVLDRST